VKKKIKKKMKRKMTRVNDVPAAATKGNIQKNSFAYAN
jgi:hypothetical protein